MILSYPINKTKRFYLYAGLFVISGWLWLLWSLSGSGGYDVSLCIFKNITQYPCPACGSTTALQLLVQGHWAAAFAVNPLGYVAGAGLLVLPVWIIFDVVSGNASLHKAALLLDNKVRQRPWLLILLLLPVILNWIWNIMKM